MTVARTQYAEADGANIAYQVIGDGPIDLVYVPGWVSKYRGDVGRALDGGVPSGVLPRSLD